MSSLRAGITAVDPRAGLDPSFVPPPGAECLSEGKAYLLDGVVYSPTAPWTPSVHAPLRHLEAVGYRGSPRLVGDGVDTEGRQVVGYIEGGLVHPHAWSDDGVIEVACLLRELHDATRSLNVAWDGADHAFLLDTKTRPDHQRRGVGTAVVKAAVEQAKAAGCEWLHVDFTGDLRPFYLDACGFIPPEAAGLINLYQLAGR